MLYSRLFSLICFGLCFHACKAEEDKADDVIAEETDLIDLTITEGSEVYDYNDDVATIGIDSLESRFLLRFPSFLNLYEEDVIISSIANLEIEIYAEDIAINPANIRLKFLAQEWTPFANWYSRFSLADGYDWLAAGGDFLDLDDATPDIEASQGNVKKLSFNVTDQTLTTIETGTVIHGFALVIEESSLNNQQVLTTYTSNSNFKPRAILTFNKREILNQ
ncbi:hypothetical protein [Pseudobacteriovorax antillogorgiicola]|uniref:DNRLRE domain-containing protein n=1 Tax=Pseudobacteriovorax antillogorgiicola TaxID=1513793 RepID=A0A1Y6BWD1_9BACT|nr:hypothetical protein [Pseudobacteriovorax antillogorgiicola]TCS50185.1 hypothetical protein EDD56_1133 [Pseudobacteriovorax antillogorgiicola]SMF32106.1 hypothetical protein SAMN06296036_1102 [Pseudobacteriovorax antillogorgiicola]